jgi:Flp pilus assembly protein TadB
MNEHVKTANGEAHQFPFGIDPRDYGLGQLEYQRQLDHHRRMEHLHRESEEHRTHMHQMAEARAQKDAAEAERAARQWWLEPLNAFASVAGFCFWLVCWGYVILSVMLWLGEITAKRDAQWCLKDVAKCERIAKGETK